MKAGFGVAPTPRGGERRDASRRCPTETPALRRAFTVSRWVAGMRGTGAGRAGPDTAALRLALARRRRVRRLGLALSSTLAASSAAAVAALHPPAPPPPGVAAVALGSAAVAAAAAAARFQAEVARDGRVYLRPRLQKLAPLHGKASVCVRETGDARGRGAFAARRIPKLTCLGAYEGELLDNAAFLSRYPADEGLLAEYAIAVDADYVLDGRDAAREGAFTPAHMNHSDDLAKINVGRIHLRRRRRVLFYTLRDVEVGEELVFNYGSDFWRGREDARMT